MLSTRRQAHKTYIHVGSRIRTDTGYLPTDVVLGTINTTVHISRTNAHARTQTYAHYFTWHLSKGKTVPKKQRTWYVRCRTNMYFLLVQNQQSKAIDIYIPGMYAAMKNTLLLIVLGGTLHHQKRRISS